MLGGTCGLLLVGCATPEKVEVTVAETVPIHCGPEPSVPRLVLKPVKPKAVAEPTPHIRFEIEDYENAAINNKRIVRQFDSLTTVIEHYRGCIEDFNGSGQTNP